MAIIEVQIRTDRFCELIKGEISSLPLDRPTLDQPAEIAGKPLERIVCTSCEFDEMRDEELVLKLTLAVDYHDDLTNLRDAGSLKPATPARKTYPFSIALTFVFETTPVPRPVLTYDLRAWPNRSTKKGAFPISMPRDLTIVAAAIRGDANVVAIRLGTAAGDPVDAPLVDRTGGRDWMQHIPGDLVAETIRGVLDRTLDAAVAPPPPPDPNKPWLPKPKKSQELHKEGPASASWYFSLATAFVMAKGVIVAIDACPAFDVDISIELTLVVRFDFPSPTTMRTRAVLTWDADSTWCDVLGALAFGVPVGIAFHVGAESDVSDAILGKKMTPGDGFAETGRTDESITFERLADAPPAPSPEFVITHGAATPAGLAVGGDIVPKVRANLVGEATVPLAAVDIDCNLRTAKVAMRPAKVFLRTDQPDRLPWFFFDKIVYEVQAPLAVLGHPYRTPDAWQIDASTEMKSPASSTPVHVVATFKDPPGGRLPPGTGTSVYLFTTYGVRWVDLGVIPELSSDLLIQVDAHRLMNIYCDSISNPWAGGLTELRWVDPLLDPDYLEREVERGRLRLWTLGLRDLPDDARIELVAVGTSGRERPLGVVEGRRNVALEVLTDTNESLALRTERAFTAPAPTLTESWFYPVSNADTHGGAPGDVALAERLAGEMANHERRGRLRWATAIRLHGETLAAPHRGRMIVGTVVRGERIQ